MQAVIRDNSADTRQRLLHAAGEIFAEHGYRQATIRDIIDRAGTNIAAVNYHFRDKLGLYTSVLRHWIGAAEQKYPTDGGVSPGASATERLRAFIRAFFLRVMDDGAPAWHGKLMAREMSDPTPGVIEMLVETHFKTNAVVLFKVLHDLLGKNAPPERVRLCAFSVVGQCLFYRHCQNTIPLMAPDQQFGRADIERIVEHISRFTLAGIESYRAESIRPRRRKRPLRGKKERV